MAAGIPKSARRIGSLLPDPANVHRHPDAEPIPDPAGHAWLDEGIAEFNAGRHWHAHEAWEHLWLGLEGDDKLFVQGLIMAAAMLHQYGRGVERGVVNHWANVQRRLPKHAPRKWGIDVAGLLEQLAGLAEPVVLGEAPRGDPAIVRIERQRDNP